MGKIIGPGTSINDETSPQPLLQGANEYEMVTILNPMTDDFQVMVAQDVPMDMPFQVKSPTQSIQDARDLARNYDLNLSNPDHKGRRYIHNTTIIPSGETKNFRGNDAQVVVRQLVNEIMQREKNQRMLSDPTARRLVEERIVMKRASIQDLMDRPLMNPQVQINEAINKSNEYTEEFPGLNSPINTEKISGSPDPTLNSDAPKRAGRPRKESTTV